MVNWVLNVKDVYFNFLKLKYFNIFNSFKLVYLETYVPYCKTLYYSSVDF